MRLIVFSLMMVMCAEAYAQTTFILVRHAEKETADSKDKNPMLSKAGQERAQALVRLLDKQKIDAIMSTNYHRTKTTVEPVASARGITIQTYESLKEPDVAKLIDAGGTVLICGHSNTIPGLANLLVGKNQFANYDESDYGNVLIVTATAVGKATVTHLRY
jgi:2,3-bisphosphoglycerate-dependent phosphoglycerate mutase